MSIYEGRYFRGETWIWPSKDYHCWKHLTKYHPDIPKQILSEIGGASVVVQAGGNCGLYTAQYASLVDEVITFEPDPVNYFCLENNLLNYDNVTMFESALGAEESEVLIMCDRKNTGASKITNRKHGNNYKVKQVRLDDFNVAPDLVHLDVEGWEHYALEGMIETLKEHHPAVAVENNNGGDFLKDLGYLQVAQFGMDWLYL